MFTLSKLDRDGIDNALHEIKQMALVAIGAAESLTSDNTDPSSDEPRLFHLSERDTDLLSFSIAVPAAGVIFSRAKPSVVK